jgi:hypothetical protein
MPPSASRSASRSDSTSRSNPKSNRTHSSGRAEGSEATGQSCDFCGDIVAAVRRVALDVEYDRLQKAHKELYSCNSCFEEKEHRRLGTLR